MRLQFIFFFSILINPLFGQDTINVAFAEYTEVFKSQVFESFVGESKINEIVNNLQLDYNQRIYVTLIIEDNGTIADSTIKILRGSNIEIDNEILRLLKRIKKVEPYIENGIPKRMQMTIPININIF